MKPSALSQLGGGRLSGGIQSALIYQKDPATGNYALQDYSFGSSPAEKIEPKPEKKDHFVEAMVGNIKRKFRTE